MSLDPMRRGAALLFLSSFAAAVTQESPLDPGERQDPSTFGPAVVETWEAMAARPSPPVEAGPLLGKSYTAVPGTWYVPPDRATWSTPASRRYLINRYGDPRMGIGFPEPAFVEGAWFAPQGDVGAWAQGVTVRCYAGDLLLAESPTPSFDTRVPVYLPICVAGVDRLVVTASCGASGRGFFALDDLSFVDTSGLRREVDFEDLSSGTDLTGSGYAGLRWEVGEGFLDRDSHAIPPPHEVENGEPLRGDPSPPAESMVARAPRLVRTIQGPRIFEPGNGFIPPDTNGAAGPLHFVALVNGSFSIYDRATGQRTHQMPIVNFWNVAGGLGDVRIVYDHHASRWVALCMDGSTRIYLAVSSSSDPTGAWFKSSILASQGADANRWPDFPTLGVDEHGIYTAALMVGQGDPITIWAIDKAPLLANPPQLGTVTAWRNRPWEGAVQPCVTFGSPGFEVLVSRSSPTALRLRKIFPPLSAPTMSQAGFVTIPAHGRAPSAPALGSTTEIATGDWRPSNAVFRNGSLYTTQTIDVSGRAAVRWYEVDVAAARLVQFGTVEDPTWSYYHASISVNRDGGLALGFSGSHAGVYVGAFATGRSASDPSGRVAPPLLYQPGLGSYERVDGNGTNRFGDYSLTTVDPNDDTSFWTIQEYVHARDAWGTSIAQLRLSCASAAPYGTGWPGTFGVPELRIQDPPVLGTSFTLILDNSRGQPTQGALLFSGATASLPFFGGTLLVQPPVLALPLQMSAWPAFLAFPLPNDASLLCTPLYLQGLVLDPGASQGVALSAGLELVVGE